MIHLALVTCLLAAQAPVATTPQSPIDSLFPAASGPLEIKIDADGTLPSYLSLVQEYAALTDQHVVFDQDTKALLEMQEVRLDRSLTIPMAEVQETLECLLRHSDFCLRVFNENGSRLLEVISLNSSARSNIRAGARYLEPDEIEVARRHPAVLFTTTVTMPNIDVRQLSNSMRMMITDANTQQLLPAGVSGAMVVVGFGDAVADLSDTLRWIDDPGEASETVPVDELFPPASGPLEITIGDPESPTSMLMLAKDYAALTGQTLVWGKDTEVILEQTTVNIDRSMTVPAAEVQTLFESLLRQRDFCLSVLKEQGARIVQITSLTTGARRGIRSSAKFLTPNKIQFAANHPAMLFTSVVAMPNTDVRQATNSMRTLITDANTQQMIPAGNSKSIVLLGFGDTLADHADMLVRIDAASLASRPVAKELELVAIRLKSAKAEEMVALLSEALGIGSPESGPAEEESAEPVVARPGDVKLMSDSRTNSVLVAAPEHRMAGLRKLIEALDR